MRLEYLSATRANVYVDCPFRYFLQYHLKLPELREPTIHTAKGSAVHEALDKFVKGETDYVAELRKYYQEHEVWKLDTRPIGKGFPHPQQKSCETCPFAIAQAGSPNAICSIAGKFTNQVEGCPRANFEDDLGILESTLMRADSPLKRKIIGSEVPFTQDWDGFRVHGFIDLITEVDDETLEVRDYKTGNYAKAANEAFRDIQMRIYSLVAKRMFPKYKYVMMTLDYLRKLPVTVIFAPEDDEKTRQFLKDVYKRIEQEQDPKRIKSFKCNWCVGFEKCGKIREGYIRDGKFRMPEATKEEAAPPPPEASD
jgi:RecB family exonuclease